MNEENSSVTPPQSDNNAPEAAGVQPDTYSAPAESEPTVSSFDVTPAAPVAPVTEPQPVVATPPASPIAPSDVTPVAEPVVAQELVTPVSEPGSSHMGLIVMIMVAVVVAVVGVVAAMMLL
jgi:hypothetical protein